MTLSHYHKAHQCLVICLRWVLSPSRAGPKLCPQSLVQRQAPRWGSSTKFMHVEYAIDLLWSPPAQHPLSLLVVTMLPPLPVVLVGPSINVDPPAAQWGGGSRDLRQSDASKNWNCGQSDTKRETMVGPDLSPPRHPEATAPSIPKSPKRPLSCLF